MQNFSFFNPVKVIFGREMFSHLDKEIPAQARVVVLYGKGSICRSGVLDKILSHLGSREVLTFGGIEPNPEYETLLKAVAFCRENKATFLLAAGGGSVIDGTKFVAAAIPVSDDPWGILTGAVPVRSAIPFGTVLTLPATGSEMNMGSVVSRRALQTKISFRSPHVFPRFSILDPEITFTLPPRQIGNGVVDAFVHTIEQYLTEPSGAVLQDRYAESILLTLIETGPETLKNPTDYNSRANFMWAATQALNGLIGVAVPQCWATHLIGHQLTAFYGLDHAQTLALVLPALLRVKKETRKAKLVQYAERVWGVQTNDDAEKVELAIARTEEFFQRMGVPTSLSAYGISEDPTEKVITKLKEMFRFPLGGLQDISEDDLRNILRLTR